MGSLRGMNDDTPFAGGRTLFRSLGSNANRAAGAARMIAGARHRSPEIAAFAAGTQVPARNHQRDSSVSAVIDCKRDLVVPPKIVCQSQECV